MTYSTEWMLDRWKTMVLIRRAEEAIAEMVDRGEAGCPCHLYIGQEAIATGVSAVLTREDTVWGGHRSHGHYLAKGGELAPLMAEILGKTSGCSGGRGGSMHLLAKEVGILGTVPLVAGTVPLAVGAGFAHKMAHRMAHKVAHESGDDPKHPPDGPRNPMDHNTAEPPSEGGMRVAVSFFGDGSIEEGHVHESMNLAALYRLPLLFICENNLYSSHMHWTERRVADNLYRAGEFHSIPGERVDGNDVIAVFEAARAAVERARAGGGPSLIECRTFRWRGHVGTSYDLDVGVQRRGELAQWMAKDPIRRLEEQLIRQGVRTLAPLESEIAAAVERAVQAARYAPPPSPERVLEHVWQEAACAS